MKNTTRAHTLRAALAASLFASLALPAQADVITDWNTKAGEFIVEAKLGTPPAVRVMALVQTAVHEAVKSATERDTTARAQTATSNPVVCAAVAAANRATLVKLLPAVQGSIDAAYRAALADISDGAAKTAGIAAGERAAAAVFAARADDAVAGADAYRPHTSAGAYVPTASPAASQWPLRKPWLMASAAQFRPAAPPALNSEAWARDFNEVKALGGKASTRRSAEQTEVARFWEYSLPPIYHGLVRSVATLPGRTPAHNARLFAAVAQAMDDGLISVFDAKYHYNFWRPATAVRNGDIDGHDATERDGAWTPLIDTPMHPEYPSAHSILASAVGTLLQAELAGAQMPVLTTSSPSAKGAVRRWTSIDDMVREVSNARIYEGVHYRVSTDVGAEMGRQIGALAAAKLLQPPQ